MQATPDVTQRSGPTIVDEESPLLLNDPPKPFASVNTEEIWVKPAGFFLIEAG